VVHLETFPDVRVDVEASSPPPDRAPDGAMGWTCRGDAGACTGFAVIVERNASGNRDLTLLLLGLLLGLGSGAMLEGVLALLRGGS
jgi:hypothetical protein